MENLVLMGIAVRGISPVQPVLATIAVTEKIRV
jgi:hypothetical protein